jgi:hypothetical protein
MIQKDGLNFVRLYIRNWVHLFESRCIYRLTSYRKIETRYLSDKKCTKGVQRNKQFVLITMLNTQMGIQSVVVTALIYWMLKVIICLSDVVL